MIEDQTSVLRCEKHSGHSVLTAVVVRDAIDLGCSVAVPDREDTVATTRFVEHRLVEYVVGIAGIALVSTEMGGNDDCEIVTPPLKPESVWVGLGCPKLDACINPAPYA